MFTSIIFHGLKKDLDISFEQYLILDIIRSIGNHTRGHWVPDPIDPLMKVLHTLPDDMQEMVDGLTSRDLIEIRKKDNSIRVTHKFMDAYKNYSL